MKKAFITGANKSIGFETARQLLQQGFYVYLGSRDVLNGQKAVAQLQAEGLNNAPIPFRTERIFLLNFGFQTSYKNI